MTTGYLVMSQDNYLTRDYRWIPQAAELHVFPDWQIADVLEMAEGFSVTPTHIIPAVDEGGRVTVTGEPMKKVMG